MIHLVTWLPLPYQQVLCTTLSEAYEQSFVAWFAERRIAEYPYRDNSELGFKHYYFSEDGYGEFWRNLKKDAEAIVILSGWSSPMTNKTLLMATLLRVPIFIWADHPHPRQRSWLVDRSRKLYLRVLARQVAGFLACGSPTVEHLASLGIKRSKITNFPYWVEIPRQWSIPERCNDREAAARPLRLLAVGRHVPVKQFEVAIKAVSLANRNAGRELAQLILAGDGPQRPELETLAATLKCGSSVTFAGWLEVDEVRSAIRETDALVLTSKFDAYGAVVLESMAAGRPVLASEGVVAARDRDDGTGAVQLHGVGDVEGLAAQIAALAFDSERLREVSIAARARAEQWPLARAVDIIDETVRKTKPGRTLLNGRREFASLNRRSG